MVNGAGGRRCGHSLVELIVAVTFLGVTLTAVTGSTLLGARWAAEAALKQRAVRVAEALLDSLSNSPAPRSGASGPDELAARWVVGPSGLLTVTVERPSGGQPLVRLQGLAVPSLPSLPDEAPAPEAGGGAS